MFEGELSWVIGGIVAIFCYIVISNTLWLLFGSRLIQFLPGVDVPGIRGTIKIALMIVLSLMGVLRWAMKYAFAAMTNKDLKPLFREEVGRMIRQGASAVERRRARQAK